MSAFVIKTMVLDDVFVWLCRLCSSVVVVAHTHTHTPWDPPTTRATAPAHTGSEGAAVLAVTQKIILLRESSVGYGVMLLPPPADNLLGRWRLERYRRTSSRERNATSARRAFRVFKQSNVSVVTVFVLIFLFYCWCWCCSLVHTDI